MLAINKLPQVVSVIGCLTLCLAAQTLFGQQPQRPSQNFTPTRTVPPSVHIPSQDVRQLGGPTGIRQADASQFRDSAVRPTSYSFSDTDVKIPEILAKQHSILPSGNVVDSMKNHMKQIDQHGVDPSTLLAPGTGQRTATNATLTGPVVDSNQFQAQGTLQNASSMPPAAPATVQNGPFAAPKLPARDLNHSTLDAKSIDLSPAASEQFTATGSQEFQPNSGTFRSPATQQPTANDSPVSTTPNPQVYGNVVENQSSSDLNNNSFQTNQQAESGNRQEGLPQNIASEPIQNPLQTTNRASDPSAIQAQPETMSSTLPDSNQRLANYSEGRIPVNGIRTVSNENTTIRNEPQISLSIPSIQVDTFGPRTIGINKTGTYKVVVTNRSNFAAEGIDIGISLPSWIEISTVNHTAGSRTDEDANGAKKLVWSVKSIPANSSHTMTIDAVPTKAQVFDVGIEWAMVPKIASTNVDVTEPRLAMKISGPNDVQYGEKAIYQVTVSNPGTGTAENVVVKLPQALGGEQAPLHDILPNQEKTFQVELLARTAGELDLNTSATADGGLETAAGRKIVVRRAQLGIQILGPPEKYSGTAGQYTVTVVNSGDAAAHNIMAAIALPQGVKYLGGIESVENEQGRIRWKIGTLDQGDQRTYKIKCELNAAGKLRLDAGVRGDGELAAAHAVETNVQTVADLVLTVADPKGPLPVGEETEYTIRVTNRGTKAANAVNLVMQFSEGIEPTKAEGLENQVEPGQVLFSPIEQIAPGQEVELTITAIADKPGTHIFRAQLVCDESESREVAEGTTKFFGDPTPPIANSNSFRPTDDNQFKR